MGIRVLLPVVTIFATGCASANSDQVRRNEAPLRESIRSQQCGFAVVRRGLFPRPGQSAVMLETGDPIRACALPTAADIEIACESEEGVPISGTRNPDNPDAPQYSFPTFTVTDHQCAFVDAAETRALCSFNLAAEGAAPSRQRVELVFRFRDFSNAVVHDWYHVGWEVDAACRPLETR